MEQYQESFITNLKYFRMKKGLSQAELAEKCDVATGTIGNIECGIAKPSFDLLIRMADTLSINPAQFFSADKFTDVQQTLMDEHKMLKDFYHTLQEHFKM
ncbi:MAG: helix-turn-helix transcriptional regulator [Spirochaetia bacterium]|nr:helix-turn-helix transcriptional regulator [Spirochaetia bacterium]